MEDKRTIRFLVMLLIALVFTFFRGTVFYNTTVIVVGLLFALFCLVFAILSKYHKLP